MIHHADTLVVNLITTLYLIFALQVAFLVRCLGHSGRQAGALLPLIATFVLCALAGYATTQLPPAYWPLREALHWGLVASSGWLVLTNQARVLAEVLRRG